jgi:hypothetical protein
MSSDDLQNSAASGNGQTVSTGDALVDRLTARLRDVPVPDGPDPRTLAETISALRAAALNQPPKQRKFLTMKTLVRFAIAASLAAIAVAAVFTLWDRNTLVFAKVVDQVKAAKSVKFKLSGKIQIPDNKAQDLNASIVIAGNRMRQDVGKDFVQTMDFDKGEVITLVRPGKQAVITTLKNMPDSTKQMNVIDQFRNMQPDKAKDEGLVKVDGREVRQFSIEPAPGQAMKVFADPKTRTPVKIEMSIQMAGMPGMTMVMSDFVWDAPVDPAAMTLEIPKDYEIRHMTMDASTPTEADLAAALKELATINVGRFPASFDLKGLSDVMAAHAPKSTEEQKAFKETAMNASMKIGRGIGFLTAANGEDFRYAGDGAKLNEANRPVLWYKPKGSQTYHVIYADLTVHGDVAADALPKIPSQKMDTFLAAFPTTNKSPETKPKP